MEKINNEKIEAEEVEVKEEVKLEDLTPESLEKIKDSQTNSSLLATEEKTSEAASPALKTGGEKEESSGEVREEHSEDEKEEVEEVEVKEEGKIEDLTPESLEKIKDSQTNSSLLATDEKTSEAASPALKTGGEKEESSGAVREKQSEDEEFLKEERNEARRLTTVENGVEVKEKLIVDTSESKIDGKSPSGTRNTPESIESSSNQIPTEAQKSKETEEIEVKKKEDLDEVKLQELIPESLEKKKNPLKNSLLGTEETSGIVLLTEEEKNEEFRQLKTVQSGVEVEEKLIAVGSESNMDGKSNEELSEVGVVKSIDVDESNKSIPSGTRNTSESTESSSNKIPTEGQKLKEAEKIKLKEVKEKKKADLEETKLQKLIPESLEDKNSLENSSSLGTKEKTSETVSLASGSAEIEEKQSEDVEFLKEIVASKQQELIPKSLEKDKNFLKNSSSLGTKKKTSITMSPVLKKGGKKQESSVSSALCNFYGRYSFPGGKCNEKSVPSGTKKKPNSTESPSNKSNSIPNQFGQIKIREDLLLKKPLSIRIKTEEHNESASPKGNQPPMIGPSKNQRKKARKMLKQLTMSDRQNHLLNLGNSPGNNLASDKNQIIVPKQEILIDDEEIGGYQGSSSGNQMIPNRNNKKKKRNEQNVLPVQKKPFRNQENRSWYSQLSPQNPENFVDQPSTSRGGVSQNVLENVSRKGKRKFKESSSGDAQNTKRPRYAESKEDLTRVIITDEYWRQGITRNELGLIRNCISQEIDRIQEGPIPRFNKSYIKLGGIVVESADLWSREWLSYMVPKLNPLNGTFLRVVGLDSVEKFFTAKMWVPGIFENPESIFKRLERQNSTLKTEVWRIYSVTDEEFTDNGYSLVLGIPQSSVQALQEIDFKPYLGLSRVTISVNGLN